MAGLADSDGIQYEDDDSSLDIQYEDSSDENSDEFDLSAIVPDEELEDGYRGIQLTWRQWFRIRDARNVPVNTSLPPLPYGTVQGTEPLQRPLPAPGPSKSPAKTRQRTTRNSGTQDGNGSGNGSGNAPAGQLPLPSFADYIREYNLDQMTPQRQQQVMQEIADRMGADLAKQKELADEQELANEQDFADDPQFVDEPQFADEEEPANEQPPPKKKRGRPKGSGGKGGRPVIQRDSAKSIAAADPRRTLEDFKEDIADWYNQGITQAVILQRLEDQFGMNISIKTLQRHLQKHNLRVNRAPLVSDDVVRQRVAEIYNSQYLTDEETQAQLTQEGIQIGLRTIRRMRHRMGLLKHIPRRPVQTQQSEDLFPETTATYPKLRPF